MYSRLHVQNLDPDTDQLALERLFAEHGEVLVTALRVDGDQSIGMVEMRLRTDARAATVALHGSEHHDRVLSVSASTAAQETAAGRPRMFTPMNAGDAPPAEAPEPRGDAPAVAETPATAPKNRLLALAIWLAMSLMFLSGCEIATLPLIKGSAAMRAAPTAVAEGEADGNSDPRGDFDEVDGEGRPLAGARS